MPDPVSDASPLLTFARADRLGLLRQVFPKVLIPPTVYNEIVVQGGGRPGAQAIGEAEWIELRELADPSMVEGVPQNLDQGEREAIALALELNTVLLIDERLGRREASRLGATLTSTLAILEIAKSRELIPAAAPVLEELLDSGFRLSKQLKTTFLERVGE